MKAIEEQKSEWKKTLELMRGLFPKWEVNAHQHKSWKDKFGKLNQSWLREALNVVYHKYNSETPKPKWVQQAFVEVRAGHQGIPLKESDAAAMARNKSRQELEAKDLQAVADRERAWFEVASWSNEERIRWADQFKNRYRFLSERNDTTDMSTWSKTFAQQVKVMREKQQ